jgi:nitroreductase
MDVFEAIKTRRSVRSYSSQPIPADLLERMRQALRLAPSAGNYQPWHFILVVDPDMRRKLAKAANDQLWMADAPVIVVGCGSAERSYKKVGGHRSSVDIDVAIAIDHLTLAAVAEGLGTCWIAAFDEGQVMELLGIPSEVRVVAMTPLGYPSSPELNYPVDESRRKPAKEIFSTDRYGQG